MLFFRKWFTLFEIIIVLALTGLFITAASYLNRDTRTYQTNAERLANYVDTSLRTAKSNMTLGRWVMSGSTLVATDKRTISIRWTGITTIYGTTNTGTESSLTWPFYDSDTAYQITDMSVSSGILMNGQMPIWDQTGVTMADITILPNWDFQIFSSSVATPIRILRITAGYAGFERSVMIDTVMGRTTSVQWRGEVDYIPAPPAPPPNSCAATPSFVNIGSTNVWSPTTAGQGWYYSTTPGNCSYDCTGGFKWASCLTPPIPSCDTNPAFPNLGTLTTGSPSSVAQAWYYSATPGDCTYACSNGYTGNNCLTAPVNWCAANPTYPNIWALTTGTPSSWNQAWSYSATPGTCTYACTGWYSGPSCATAPCTIWSGNIGTCIIN